LAKHLLRFDNQMQHKLHHHYGKAAPPVKEKYVSTVVEIVTVSANCCHSYVIAVCQVVDLRIS
jgi:hypothetical protein